MFDIRDYRAADERGWLLCRLLSFFNTDYYDDVKVSKTPFANPAIELDTVRHDEVVGLIDVEIDGDTATIDSIAVHPSSQRMGIAAALLREMLRKLPASVATLDVWTRETPSANEWYRAIGFREEYRYLHVYRGDDDPSDGFATPAGLSLPVIAFMHASIESEAELRAAYRRVYLCRQYVMPV